MLNLQNKLKELQHQWCIENNPFIREMIKTRIFATMLEMSVVANYQTK
jgi:hypothetical protein